MISENTAQVKAQLIKRINNIKPEAIALGFDYPTESPENASINELIDFLVELSAFIGYEVGYNDAETGYSEEPFVTH